MVSIGKLLILLGVGLVVMGAMLAMGPGIGRLPGDIAIKKDNYVVYIPLLSSIIVSIVLSLVFWVITRYFEK